MKLYAYWRSTSSYRVRIALELKGMTVPIEPVHLVKDGGEQNSAAFRLINAQGRVPVLVLDDGVAIPQSPAILEYIEERYPAPPLLPRDAARRALVRAAAAILACDVHALHNVATLNALRTGFGASQDDVDAWLSRWIREGLHAFQALIEPGTWCFGAAPGLADVYALPALYAARRFGVSMTGLDRLAALEDAANSHPAFRRAHPGQQVDAE